MSPGLDTPQTQGRCSFPAPENPKQCGVMPQRHQLPPRPLGRGPPCSDLPQPAAGRWPSASRHSAEPGRCWETTWPTCRLVHLACHLHGWQVGLRLKALVAASSQQLMHSRQPGLWQHSRAAARLHKHRCACDAPTVQGLVIGEPALGGTVIGALTSCVKADQPQGVSPGLQVYQPGMLNTSI